MRRIFFPAVPLFVAAAVLVLTPPTLRAQQEHDHAAPTGAGQACACCGKTGSEAMSHATTGSCCGAAATQAADSAVDHSAHTLAASVPAQEPGTTHAGGCCSNMTARTDTASQNGGCCGGAASASATTAQTDHLGQGCCGSMAMGKGEGSAMPMGDESMMSDMQLFHYLLANRADIRRTVKMLPNGIDTLTESDKPEIAAKLKVHVAAMYARLKEGRPIHQRDPLFVELFAHADQIDATITNTDKGLRVVETSADPAVAKLLHKHAEVVNGFLQNGMAEMMKNHTVE